MRRLALALAAIFLGSPAAAQEAERITHYLSDVQVQRDGSYDVTETIDVIANHDRINHGIYRDFPTRYRGRYGKSVKVDFQLLDTTRDGSPEPSSLEGLGNGVRVKIGDPDVVVPIGPHRYTLHYRTTRQLGRFANFDEVYWNATGNGWIFPIDLAEARIRLPRGARFGARSVYTGAQGATAANAEVTSEAPGDIMFRTTQPLGAYEGLTVAVAFPKGVVDPPSSGQQLLWWLQDYGPPIVAVLALLGLLSFYYTAWKRVGRDPRAGTVVPLFQPPDDLSPAAMRYVETMGTDNRSFAAALVDLGVRGHLRLIHEDGGWFSKDKTRIDRLNGSKPVPGEEQAMLDALIAGPDGSILMTQDNHSTFAAARERLDEPLKARFDGKLFKRNVGWAAAGLALVAAAVWLVLLANGLFSGAAMGRFALASVGALGLAAIAYGLGWNARSCGRNLLIVALLGSALLASAPAILAGFVASPPLAAIVPLLALPVAISAFFWISAPTPEGRTVLDHIAGFKQYLSIAERERLDRMTAPDDTPELFEKYLPYAIALGVETSWADRFQSVLAAAAAQGHQGFGWYSGSSNPWDDPTGFADAVGSSLSSTVSAASTAPGSSSGSGGGGFSGGGGGGGGGGGW